MWPSLFADGWTWGILVTLAMLGVILGGPGLMFYLLRRPRETREPIDRIWHRFEEGVLTRAEFERLRQGAVQADKANHRFRKSHFGAQR